MVVFFAVVVVIAFVDVVLKFVVPVLRILMVVGLAFQLMLLLVVAGAVAVIVVPCAAQLPILEDFLKLFAGLLFTPFASDIGGIHLLLQLSAVCAH